MSDQHNLIMEQIRNIGKEIEKSQRVLSRRMVCPNTSYIEESLTIASDEYKNILAQSLTNVGEQLQEAISQSTIKLTKGLENYKKLQMEELAKSLERIQNIDRELFRITEMNFKQYNFKKQIQEALESSELIDKLSLIKPVPITNEKVITELNENVEELERELKNNKEEIKNEINSISNQELIGIMDLLLHTITIIQNSDLDLNLETLIYSFNLIVEKTQPYIDHSLPVMKLILIHALWPVIIGVTTHYTVKAIENRKVNPNELEE
ncbi:hypothetical protein [Orenia marismortui]|uniref:Uncharacterized protein n=1 Tax=Orenia marismortui TaxID=46469 RepID=A0A4R8GZT3_9FIRM|nr:hypothetical protein [Orenia marismortui]TDX52183.1 hypothetical protein C7959_108105 [Orenia marismortui]